MALTRGEVIEGAVRLLDAEGLDALTMRRLADSLGVQAGAIYWHFKDKQDLYDAMAESFLDGLLEPAVAGTWEEQLAELARRIAAALSRYRDGARLATQALRPGPNGLALSERLLDIVRAAGFTRHAAVWATAVIGYYVLGYVTDVQATEAAKARGLDSALRSFKKGLDPKRHPRLFEVSKMGLAQMMSRREFETRFEFGLEVLLNGLKSTRPPRAITRRRRRRR